MKKKLQKYLSGEREGFSLVELIIVIAIMAILIGVVALVVLPYLESARESRDRQALSEVTNAFKSAMSNEAVLQEVATKPLPSTAADAAALPNGKVKDKLESYLEGTLAEAEASLSSEQCKEGKFGFAVVGDKYYVCILKKGGGLAYDKDDFAFDSDKSQKSEDNKGTTK